MGELLKTGCTCSTDHLYLYPRGLAGDFMALQFQAAEKLGMRFSPSRGSMSLSRKDGGLPPDSVVQDEDTILADCERVIGAFHDPAPRAMRKVVLAPCSPFSVSEELMRESARLARRHGVRVKMCLEYFRDIRAEKNNWSDNLLYHKANGGPYESMHDYLSSSQAVVERISRHLREYVVWMRPSEITDRYHTAGGWGFLKNI